MSGLWQIVSVSYFALPSGLTLSAFFCCYWIFCFASYHSLPSFHSWPFSLIDTARKLRCSSITRLILRIVCTAVRIEDRLWKTSTSTISSTSTFVRSSASYVATRSCATNSSSSTRSRTINRRKSPWSKRANISARRVSRASATGSCSINTSRNLVTLTKSSCVKYAVRNFIRISSYLNISVVCTSVQVHQTMMKLLQISYAFTFFILDETFSCPSCSKVFATKPNLDSHIKKIHQNDNKKFVCETCNNSFSSAPNLKQHIKTVHEVEVMTSKDDCRDDLNLISVLLTEGIWMPDLQKAI